MFFHQKQPCWSSEIDFDNEVLLKGSKAEVLLGSIINFTVRTIDVLVNQW